MEFNNRRELTQTIRDLTRAMNAIINRGWTQGAFARNRNGEECDVRSGAACFCSLGAIEYATKSKNGDRHELRCEKASDALALGLPRPYKSVVPYNDKPGRTRSQVVSLFQRAIKKLEKRLN
jgi:hypothetical protein